MTVLDESPLDREGLVGIVFEAPHHTSDSYQRRRWVELGTPFFDSRIYQFWRTYSNSTPEFTGSQMIEADERARFIKSTITVAAVEREGSFQEVVGGIWVDKRCGYSKRDALIHITVSPQYRKTGSPLYSEYTSDALLAYFLAHHSSLYDSLTVSWGRRDENNDPSRFLRRNGFEIAPADRYGISHAVLRLSSRQ